MLFKSSIELFDHLTLIILSSSPLLLHEYKIAQFLIVSNLSISVVGYTTALLYHQVWNYQADFGQAKSHIHLLFAFLSLLDMLQNNFFTFKFY